MRILMMTNTYTPLVGGLERSVRDFTQAYRARGHEVLVVAPVFEGMPRREVGVLRIPALQRFNGSDFAVKLPMPAKLTRALVRFRPDIVHAHHPFLIGNTALRLAHTQRMPLVFTHHTLYEQYTHYLPVDTEATQRFVMQLSTGYANLCDLVFAPSQSVAKLLRERGVRTRVEILPTGIQVTRFARGSRQRGRERLGIPPEAFVIGHVGRLAEEKNLGWLTGAVSAYLAQEPRAWCLIAGSGPSLEPMQAQVSRAGVADRVRFGGVLEGQELVDAYHAMDVFAFASKSETQGLVVAEAMAAGVPVVAVDAPGVRDVVEDGRNGWLLPHDVPGAFVQALRQAAALDPAERRRVRREARATAESLSLDRMADRALALYADLMRRQFVVRNADASAWAKALRRAMAEWEVFRTVTKATGVALGSAAASGGR